MRGVVIGVLGVGLGCAASGAFTCTDDDQCRSAGAAGVCQPTGYCSFEDEACASGQRYGAHASADLAGICVPPGAADTASTGGQPATTANPQGEATSSGQPVAESTSSGPAGSTTGASTGAAASTGPGLDPSLVAWYRFENGGLDDSTANQLHGSCGQDACASVTPGVIGDAVLFDGVDDIVHVAHDPALEGLEGLTVAAFVRPTNHPTVNGVTTPFAKAAGDLNNNSWELMLHLTATSYRWRGCVGDSTGIPICANMSDPTLDWIHLATTWDGATVTLYANGVPVGSNPTDVIEFDDSDMTIGGDIDSLLDDNFFDGAIDELRIYDRALEAAEIEALAQG